MPRASSSTRAGAEGDRGRHPLEQPPHRGIVDTQHRAPARLHLLEQPRLDREVVLEIGVEVEVVARQVGEAADVEGEAAHPALRQRVRGDLHRRRARAEPGELGEHAGEIGGFRRRALAGRHQAREAVAERAQSAARQAGGLEHGGGELDHGRLAVGAGDADQDQGAVGVAVDRLREIGE